jgi:O-antigen/teichoic acid export membrane protein
MKQGKSSLKRNYTYNLLYRIVTLVTPLITAPYISRVIGADGIGQYSYTYAISHYFLIFAVLGVSDYGNRCIAKVRDSKEERNKVFSEIVSLQILLSVGMSILYIIYCLVIAENKRLAYMQGVNVLSAIFDVTWLLFGLELFYVTTLRNVIVKIGTVLLILLLVKSPNDVWKYTLIMSGGTLVGQLSVWPILRNYVCFIRPKWNDVIKHLKPNLVLFLPVIANDLLGYFDKIMIGNMSIDAELGCYDNAEKLLSIPNSLVTALGTVMLPRVSNSIAKGELKSVNEMIQKSMLFVVFATSALAFGICAVAKEFVPLFFGTGFDLVVPLLYTLAPYIIFVSWANVLKTQVLLPNNKDMTFVVCLILGAFVNVVLNYCLIGTSGAVGAAIATTISEGLIAVSETVALRKLIDVKRYLIQGLPFILFGFLMFSVIRDLYVLNDIITLICKVMIGAIVYLVCSWLYIYRFYPDVITSLKVFRRKKE